MSSSFITVTIPNPGGKFFCQNKRMFSKQKMLSLYDSSSCFNYGMNEIEESGPRADSGLFLAQKHTVS